MAGEKNFPTGATGAVPVAETAPDRKITDFAVCDIDLPESTKAVEEIRKMAGFDALYGICVKRRVKDSGDICVEYNWAPYRRSGLLRRGVCITAEKVLVKYWCRENWNGTGCDREEEELEDVDYNYIIRRISELGAPKDARGFVRIINFVDAYLE